MPVNSVQGIVYLRVLLCFDVMNVSQTFFIYFTISELFVSMNFNHLETIFVTMSIQHEKILIRYLLLKEAFGIVYSKAVVETRKSKSMMTGSLMVRLSWNRRWRPRPWLLQGKSENSFFSSGVFSFFWYNVILEYSLISIKVYVIVVIIYYTYIFICDMLF